MTGTSRFIIMRMAASAVIVAGALLVGCGDEPGSATEDIVEDVTRFLAEYMRTLETKDVDAIRRLYVDDDRFAWHTDGVTQYSSPDALLEGLKQFGAVDFKTALTETVVVSLGSRLAHVRTRFLTTLEFPDSPSHSYGGVITMLVERNSGQGDWRVVSGHTSTPGAPPGRKR